MIITLGFFSSIRLGFFSAISWDFSLPSVGIFLCHQKRGLTARFLNRILSLLHRILSFLYWIFSLLHRILSLFEWESWFGFFSSISREFFLPSVGIFLFHQSGFFSAIRNKAVTARVLHRILSVFYRILTIFKDRNDWNFSLPSVGVHAQEAAASWTPALRKLRRGYDNLYHEWSWTT